MRRGPLGTNFDYVLATQPLVDDVSTDPLQLTARASDIVRRTHGPTIEKAGPKVGDFPGFIEVQDPIV